MKIHMWFTSFLLLVVVSKVSLFRKGYHVGAVWCFTELIPYDPVLIRAKLKVSSATKLFSP